VSERDQLASELRRQIAETADLRQRLESVQELAKARDAERAERSQLLSVALEPLLQLSKRLGGG
jgi:hypothetical protein